MKLIIEGNKVKGYEYKKEGVIISDGVTSIGNCAFSKCKNITSVVIPNSVTSIGDYAFYNCSSLESITIPDSVICIGYKTFDGCKNLVVYCNKDSYAENYCVANGIKYEVTE